MPFKILIIALFFQNAVLCLEPEDKAWPYEHSYQKAVKIQRVNLDSNYTSRAPQDFEPIRIRIVSTDSVNLLPTRQKANVLHIINEAVHFWSQALLVKRLTVPIRLNRDCPTNRMQYIREKTTGKWADYCKAEQCSETTTCGDALVPPSHLDLCRYCKGYASCGESGQKGDGVSDADMVLYFTYKKTEACERVAAYAGYCAMETSLDRPIAGHATLCPQAHSIFGDKFSIDVLKHELAHVLGFSPDHYAYFRDQNGEPRTARNMFGMPPEGNLPFPLWSDNTIKYVEMQWKSRAGTFQRGAFFVVTPTVVNEARKHFGCSDLEGVELQTTDSDYSHWARRVMQNDGMSAYGGSKFSRITLALMEDTGWYKVNYNLAHSMSWGKNWGCDFCMKSCMEYMDSRRMAGKDIYPFCNSVGQVSCTADRESIAKCSLVRFKGVLPAKNQYFDEIEGVSADEVKYYGGSDRRAEYCPSYVIPQGIATRQALGSCNSDPDTLGSNTFLETRGSSSKCFDIPDAWNVSEEGMSSSIYKEHGCFKYTCSEENYKIHLNISGVIAEYPCYRTNERMNFAAEIGSRKYLGAICCPNMAEICKGYDVSEKQRWKPRPKSACLVSNFSERAVNVVNPSTLSNSAMSRKILKYALFVALALYYLF